MNPVTPGVTSLDRQVSGVYFFSWDADTQGPLGPVDCFRDTKCDSYFFPQAKEEFGSDSELGVLCKLLAAHS